MALYFLALGVLVVGTVAYNFSFDPELDKPWEKFKLIHNKRYNEKEEVKRRQIFEQSIAQITQHNMEADLGMHSYTLGLNEFSDLGSEEFASAYNGFRSSVKITNRNNNFIPPSNTKIPDRIDWRTMGYVTPVGDQGNCGSCWAFSASGSLEGQWKKKTGNLVELSKQNLIDCSWPEGNRGCDGGEIDYAFEYIRTNRGIDTERSYPQRTAGVGRCLFRRSGVGATVSGFVNISPGNEEVLKQAVATIGPISVAIDASSPKFQLYRDGVYNEPICSSKELNHAVLVVGYGTEGGIDYWTVKNRSVEEANCLMPSAQPPQLAVSQLTHHFH